VKIALATIQTPFIYGGAEYLIQGLQRALRHRNHEVERIAMPFRFDPIEEVFRSVDIWQSEDFERLNGHNVDRVICLQFPAYCVRHPRKVLWLLHQYRAVYDLWGTPFTEQFRAHRRATELRDLIHEADRQGIAECDPRYTISANVSARLERFNGISSRALYHPPFAAEQFFCTDPEMYVFAPSRLEQAKRQDLLIQAMKNVRSNVVALIAGEGGQSDRLRKLAQDVGVADRVRFLGAVTEEEKIGLYAHALCVFFAPYDEDYGYVTLEAMLASKPVITCTDSGGPLEFVIPDETALVVPPAPTDLAAAIDRLAGNVAASIEMGRHARERYNQLNISWDTVVAALTDDTASRPEIARE
jgi:glycosyltransferase involved in cell wall biosynthesis